MSQEELADRADLHQTYISGIERGIRNPTIMVIDKLADALEAEPEALVTRRDFGGDQRRGESTKTRASARGGRRTT